MNSDGSFTAVRSVPLRAGRLPGLGDGLMMRDGLLGIDAVVVPVKGYRLCCVIACEFPTDGACLTIAEHPASIARVCLFV